MMSQMQELYEKVARDGVLQAKFSQILQDAEKAGVDETRNRLLSFAKEAGYEVGLGELQEFFQSYSQPKEEDLSDAELDMVAGGKSPGDTVRYVVNFSFLTTHMDCFNTKS